MRKYILERDIQPPHLSQPRKLCNKCGNELPNDFVHFQKVPFRTQRFGPRHTTSTTCKECVGKAISVAARLKHQSAEAAEQAMAQDILAGRYLK